MAFDRAAAVDLGHVPHRFVGRLSGGMKRRVSLAVSMIGEPKVVFLDEPTTGLDPETKRSMWSLIDLFKQGRSIVLTTHSMEEADALCGRIGIMAYGRLKCLGTSLHLKNKFGEGYKMEITYRDGALGAAEAFMQQAAPGCLKVADFAGVATFQVSFGGAGGLQLSDLFERMEARSADSGVIDWAMRQTVPRLRSNRQLLPVTRSSSAPLLLISFPLLFPVPGAPTAGSTPRSWQSMEEVFLKISHASEVEQLERLERKTTAKKMEEADNGEAWAA